jgi:pyruvate/2-oxoglutarate dehydrogenase complex dihydrolipoamide dehydrogenase (E3) component
MGEARFEGPGVVAVDGERLRAPRVVIATGAAPRPLPLPGLEEAGYLTSDDVLTLRELPERLLVIGAGPVGLELGQALGRLGSRVTMVEVADRLLAGGEPEVGEALAELLAGEGIELLLGAEVARVETRPDGGPRLAVEHDGRALALDGDAILLGAGRGPLVGPLRLEAAGVGGGPKGIPVDARLRTTQDGHYAAGDVLGPPFGAFTPTARRLGREAVDNALDLDPHDVSRDDGPTAIFTDPEAVTIGLTEAQAREAGHDVGVATSGFSGGKARAWGRSAAW